MENWRKESNHQLLEKGLQWDFIPAGTPSYGGLWERVVGLFKRHLVSATRGDVLHVDTFNTIIIEIEGILNRRPITPMSTDPNDTETISPANILYPATFSHSAATIIPGNIDDGNIHRRSQGSIVSGNFGRRNTLPFSMLGQNGDRRGEI